MWSSWAVRQIRHNYLWKDIANTTDVENGIEVFQSDDAAFNNDTSYNGLYKDGAIPMWAINLMATCKYSVWTWKGRKTNSDRID